MQSSSGRRCVKPKHPPLFFLWFLNTIHNLSVLSSSCLSLSILSRYIVVDAGGTKSVEALREHIQVQSERVNVVPISLASLASVQELTDVTRNIGCIGKRYFACYLFCTRLVLDKILTALPRGVVSIDLDVMVLGNLLELWQHLNQFSPSHIFGLSHELQPTYRINGMGNQITPHTPGFNGASSFAFARPHTVVYTFPNACFCFFLLSR